MSGRRVGFLALVLCAILVSVYWLRERRSTPAPVVPSSSEPTTVASSPDSATEAVQKKQIEAEMDRLLGKSETQQRTLAIPTHPSDHPTATPAPTPSPSQSAERTTPPPPVTMGIVLLDKTPVYDSAQAATPLFTMETGDLVEVKPDPMTSGRLKARPRVDVFLAATTQHTEAAGSRYPDRLVWMPAERLQVLPIDQAVEYTQESEPMTLGNNDPNFSTYDFYTRAMKNPDPAIHRIVGARLIALVSLHEDYSPSWKPLYRDPDPKVRSLALATIRSRGVRRSRSMVDDMIARVNELTQVRANGEDEEEAVLLVEVLKDSGQPRALEALASFRESWAGKQSDRLIHATH